jgi:dynein heavy chain
VPWDDLRYIFGEIMYGGHIVEDWDRRLAGAYLLKYFNEGLLEGLEMFPGFMTPGNSLSHKQVRSACGCASALPCTQLLPGLMQQEIPG